MATELTADVPGLQFCARLYKAAEPRKDITLFCLPGGGASRDYFDLAPNYSFANIMCASGFDVIAMDHPGTATNKLPDSHGFLAPRQSAAYINKCIDIYREQAGLSAAPIIGVGHSMGGMMTVLTHAEDQVFDAAILLGSSAGGLEWGLDDHEKAYIDDAEAFSSDIEALTRRKFKCEFPPSMGGPSGKSITFGGENPEVTSALRGATCELYAAGGMMSMTRGSFDKEVKTIAIPLFFAFGDHDIGIPPQEAPKAYTGAASTDLLILENTGHNSFAFSSVHTLCRSLDTWISDLFIFHTP